MSFRDVKSRTAVLESLAECDLLGVDRFRTAYGFGPALTFTLQHDGREYDSKAILAVAHKYQFPNAGALKASDFSGGKAHAARHLTRLGFAVTGVEPGEKDWRVHEVEAVVADYFDMMEAVRRGEPINKARRVRTLSTTIVGRNEASIGRKHGNISSILRDLDVPWLKGFTPLSNTQLLLEAIVSDWLSGHPDFYDRVVTVVKRNDPEYPVEVAPPNTTLLNPTAYSRHTVRVDFAARDESNRALGRAGERWALDQLKARMIDGGGGDLAPKVE